MLTLSRVSTNFPVSVCVSVCLRCWLRVFPHPLTPRWSSPFLWAPTFQQVIECWNEKGRGRRDQLIDRLRGAKKEQQKQNFELKIKRPEIIPVSHLALSQFFLLSIPLIFTGRVKCEKKLQLFRFYSKHGCDSQAPVFFICQVS